MCLFCKIIKGEIPAAKVFEDDRCVAIRDINPQAPTHVLILPREHIATMNDLSAAHEGLVGHLLKVGAELAKKEGVDQSGYRLVFNTNDDGGQTVFHIHLHVLGGRPFGWPPG